MAGPQEVRSSKAHSRRNTAGILGASARNWVGFVRSQLVDLVAARNLEAVYIRAEVHTLVARHNPEEARIREVARILVKAWQRALLVAEEVHRVGPSLSERLRAVVAEVAFGQTRSS